MTSVPKQLLSSLVVSYALLHIRSVVPTVSSMFLKPSLFAGLPILINGVTRRQAEDRTVIEFNDFSLFHKIHTKFPLQIDVTVYSRQQNLEWRPHMIIHYIVDVCGYMNGMLGNKILDIIANDLKKFSNFMHPCPHRGHFYLRNMTLNDEHFPTIVPRAEVFIDFQYFMYVNGTRKWMHYLRPYLEVKTKGIVYFK